MRQAASRRLVEPRNEVPAGLEIKVAQFGVHRLVDAFCGFGCLAGRRPLRIAQRVQRGHDEGVQPLVAVGDGSREFDPDFFFEVVGSWRGAVVFLRESFRTSKQAVTPVRSACLPLISLLSLSVNKDRPLEKETGVWFLGDSIFEKGNSTCQFWKLEFPSN